MNRIIIENRTDIPDLRCLDFVKEVVKMGRISNFDKQYCYASVLETEFGSIAIFTDLNKKSDRFVIQRN